MYSYMRIRNGPVVDGMEAEETVFAKDQRPYLPLRTLVSPGEMGRVISRWTPSEQQRREIAEGADIFLELHTFHQPLQPIRMAVSDGKMHHDWVRVCLLERPIRSTDALG